MKDKIFLGIRKLAQNRKGGNTTRILLPSIFKTLTEIPFNSKVKVYLIDGINLLIEPIKDGEE